MLGICFFFLSYFSILQNFRQKDTKKDATFFSIRWDMLGILKSVIFAGFRSCWYSGYFLKLEKKTKKKKSETLHLLTTFCFLKKKQNDLLSWKFFSNFAKKKNCKTDLYEWTVSKKQKNNNSYMLGTFQKTKKQNLFKTCKWAMKTARPFIKCIKGSIWITS